MYVCVCVCVCTPLWICRYLENGDVVEVQGLGLAEICNLVQIRCLDDAIKLLGKDLAPIAYSSAHGKRGVAALKELAQSVGLHPQQIENGRCWICNLKFHSGLMDQQKTRIAELEAQVTQLRNSGR